MEIIPSNPGKNSPDGVTGRLLAAVQEDRWLPILRLPLDLKEEDPRMTQVLQPVLTILGRLAVAVQAAYEQACEPGYPLVKANSSKNEVQFVVPATQEGFYDLVFLRGGKNRQGRLCRQAKFASIPEAYLPEAAENFLTLPKKPGCGSDFLSYYLPFLGSCYSNHATGYSRPIKGAERCSVIGFNEDGYIKAISTVNHQGRILSYSFGEGNEVNFVQYTSNTREWSGSWNSDQKASLNRDGIFRKLDGQPVDSDIGKDLLNIVLNFPLIHCVQS
ncbi:MAG: hypothetical protein NUV73_03760 [Candidatus Daviesbacteria bacterium]|nr:hypothetical protein [Candidatus Daviesbacteria bacterium]